jgi:hypothetical protein
MRLASEIPTAHLADLSPLFDFDFVIPHKLDDPQYAEFYSERHDVECILDNGFHELGHPITRSRLNEYYRLLQPDWIISPDNLSDVTWTLEQAKMSADMWNPAKCAGNVFGETPRERMKMVEEYLRLEFGMVCFPYRKRNPEWFEDHSLNNAISLLFERVHFLGAISAGETLYLAQKYPFASIDTAKPIKWGMRGSYLNHVINWHGGWKGEYDTFSDARVETASQEACINWNIAYLRKLMSA